MLCSLLLSKAGETEAREGEVKVQFQAANPSQGASGEGRERPGSLGSRRRVLVVRPCVHQVPVSAQPRPCGAGKRPSSALLPEPPAGLRDGAGEARGAPASATCSTAKPQSSALPRTRVGCIRVTRQPPPPGETLAPSPPTPRGRVNHDTGLSLARPAVGNRRC